MSLVCKVRSLVVNKTLIGSLPRKEKKEREKEKKRTEIK